MAQYFWTAEDYSTGDTPTDAWTDTTGTLSFDIASDTDGLHMAIQGAASEREALEFDLSSADDQVQVYVRGKADSSGADEDVFAFLRWTNITDPSNWDATRIDYNPSASPGEERLSEYDGGSFNELASQESGVSAGNVIEFRGEDVTGDVKGRWWADADPEPSTWDLSAQGSITGTGQHGFGHWTGNEFRVYSFGVGTEGDVAPTEPVSTGETVSVPSATLSTSGVAPSIDAGVEISVPTTALTTSSPSPAVGTAVFDVTITNAPATVTEGDTYTVDYDVTNTGGVSGTQTVNLNMLEQVNRVVIEDFETYAANDTVDSLAAWTSDGGWTVTDAFPVEGSLCALRTGGEGRSIWSNEGDGLGDYPSAGEVPRMAFNGTGTGAGVGLSFGIPAGSGTVDDSYQVRVYDQDNSNGVEIRYYDNGSSTTIASDTSTGLGYNPIETTRYDLAVDWTYDSETDEVTLDYYVWEWDGSSWSQLTNLTAVDDTGPRYTSGGVGASSWGVSDDAEDNAVDLFQIGPAADQAPEWTPQ